MKKFASLLIATLLLFSLEFLSLQAQTGQINRDVVGSGGMVGIFNADGSKISGLTGQCAISTVLSPIKGSDNYNLNQGFWIPGPIIGTDVEEIHETTYKDLFNYPNPVTTNTTFEFYLKESSYVTLTVYGLMGNEVKVLLDEIRASGFQKIEWNTKDYNGLDLPAGSYWYEVQIHTTDITGAGSFRSYALRNVLIIVR